VSDASFRETRNAKCPVSRNAKCEMPGFAKREMRNTVWAEQSFSMIEHGKLVPPRRAAARHPHSLHRQERLLSQLHSPRSCLSRICPPSTPSSSFWRSQLWTILPRTAGLPVSKLWSLFH
jgi:hypothetical protein